MSNEIKPDQVVLATEVYLGHWAFSHQTAKRTTDASALFYFAEDGDVAPLVKHQIRKGQGKQEPGKRFHLYLVECDDEGPAESEPDQQTRPYGQQAKILRQSAFFRTPAVWEALGTDAEFQAWVTYQRSIVSGEFSEYDDAGNGRCVACHVRRAGEAGTAYKPAYACVPMTDAEHRDQHANGENAPYLTYLKIKYSTAQAAQEKEVMEPAGAWFDRKRIDTVQAWAWQRLKALLGRESMADVPPIEVRGWAELYDIAEYLPDVYRGAA